MGAHSEDPHLCWASRLLGFSSLVLSAFSTVVNGSGTHGSQVEDSGNVVSVKGTQGSSVSFLVTRSPESLPGVKLEISWGIKNKSNYLVLLQVSPGEDVPKWVNFQDKFEKRVHVLNTTTLRIDNLTLEDSGQYWARVSLTGGRETIRYFHLTVYEPVPRPQILAKTPSVTPDWCNVTLECHAPGTREDVNVSWENKGLPRELEQRGVPGPAPNPWTLALKLPLSQPSPSITCVVSNPGDRKTATRDLGEVCAHGPLGQAGAGFLRDILGALGITFLILGAGLYLRCSRGKKQSLEPGRGSQEEHRDHDDGIQYAELSQQTSRESRDQGSGEPHLEQETPLTTVYSEVRHPGQGLRVI
ncbi:SLAM family member 5-like isoform X2 [Prionailurus bengalensis]|uniref:SLAM family member 5-like isoform X2 n=1 Tax=Prionailurus bengalensis TaxID=37029 RepID=UPI001CA92186|nr:SLAM family member 5-like isoform X2 [Prionailurus bengalensis]